MFIYQMLFAKCYSRCLRYSDNTKPLPVWRLHSGGEAQQWSINQITICQIKINMVKKNREMNQHRLRRSFYLFCLTFNFILDYSQWTVLCSFRWIAKGFSYTYTCIHSPPNSREVILKDMVNYFLAFRLRSNLKEVVKELTQEERAEWDEGWYAGGSEKKVSSIYRSLEIGSSLGS